MKYLSLTTSVLAIAGLASGCWNSKDDKKEETKAVAVEKTVAIEKKAVIAEEPAEEHTAGDMTADVTSTETITVEKKTEFDPGMNADEEKTETQEEEASEE